LVKSAWISTARVLLHIRQSAAAKPPLPTIDAPALLIYGTKSNFHPPATAVFVKEAIPGATLLMYEGADHSPHLNQPDRFVADLIRFAGCA
jgi:pimeloyl-ACP methyl ester carboxylesterase